MRKVIIYNSQTSAKETINTEVKTWGELKGKIGMSIGDRTCVLSGSKHILALGNAELPEGDFTVFVYPKESKGGMAAKKKAKKVAKKAAKKPAKKAKKSAKKKPSSKVKETLSKTVSAVEESKANEEEKLRQESQEIAKAVKGYR